MRSPASRSRCCSRSAARSPERRRGTADAALGAVSAVTHNDLAAQPQPTARIERAVATAQGAFFVATGIWPIVHLRSFEAVTGPKASGWLVKTVGALIASVGASLIVGAREPRVSASTRALGVLASASLGAADVWYGGRGRIARVYLLDAAVEAAFVAAWGLAAWRRRRA